MPRLSRTAECLRCQFAPMAARSARAHQEASARARRGAGCPLRPLRGHLPQRGRRDLAPPSGAATSRWDVAQRPVSAAASVGDGRSPLGCITRAGRRECPRWGRRGFLQQPTPRTCASLLMSTSGASCHRRESSGVPPPGSFCLVKGKSEVFFRDFSLFAGESGCFLQNPRAVL